MVQEHWSPFDPIEKKRKRKRKREGKKERERERKKEEKREEKRKGLCLLDCFVCVLVKRKKFLQDIEVRGGASDEEGISEGPEDLICLHVVGEEGHKVADGASGVDTKCQNEGQVHSSQIALPTDEVLQRRRRRRKKKRERKKSEKWPFLTNPHTLVLFTSTKRMTEGSFIYCWRSGAGGSDNSFFW